MFAEATGVNVDSRVARGVTDRLKFVQSNVGHILVSFAYSVDVLTEDGKVSLVANTVNFAVFGFPGLNLAIFGPEKPPVVFFFQI